MIFQHRDKRRPEDIAPEGPMEFSASTVSDVRRGAIRSPYVVGPGYHEEYDRWLACLIQRTHVTPLVEEYLPSITDRVTKEVIAGRLLSITSLRPPLQIDALGNEISDLMQFIKPKHPEMFSTQVLRCFNKIAKEDSRLSERAIRAKVESIKNREMECLTTVEKHLDHLVNPTNDISHPIRSLSAVLQNGLSINVDAVHREQLREALFKSDGACPVLDAIKGERIFDIVINNHSFPGLSKGSLATHDLFDHVYFGILLERSGIMKRYPKLFGQLAHPLHTDMFSLPGEFIAMIAYDWRAWQSRRDACPRVCPGIYEANVARALRDPQLSKPAKKFIKELELLPFADEKTEQFAYILSGMLHETHAMALKSGRFILPSKSRSDKQEHFDPFAPQFISFTIEALQLLNDPKNESSKALCNLNINLEDRLLKIALGNSSKISIPNILDLFKTPPPDCSVSLPRQKWIREHLGFNALRESLCGPPL